MAMINCKECGKQISSEASVCPYCGKPTEYKEINDKAKGLLIGYIIGYIFSIAILWFCSNSDNIPFDICKNETRKGKVGFI